MSDEVLSGTLWPKRPTSKIPMELDHYLASLEYILQGLLSGATIIEGDTIINNNIIGWHETNVVVYNDTYAANGTWYDCSTGLTVPALVVLNCVVDGNCTFHFQAKGGPAAGAGYYSAESHMNGLAMGVGKYGYVAVPTDSNGDIVTGTLNGSGKTMTATMVGYVE